ncbi:MAG: hypothetical protein MI974_31320 [Chitinophagales bacterium]|nr:hypothetical protein [Chitinophagales bacterium]
MEKIILVIIITLMSNFGYAQKEKSSFKEYLNETISYRYLESDTNKIKKLFKRDFKNQELLVFGSRLHKVLNYLSSEEEKQKKLSGKVSLGFNSDNSNSTFSESTDALTQYNIISSFLLKMGTYPTELEIKSTVNITLNDGELITNLADQEISYDRYINENYQPFIYLRRFSDKFMSIDNRFEVGGGVVLDIGKKAEDLYIDIDHNVNGGKIDTDKLVVYSDNAEYRKIYERLNKNGKEELKKLELIDSIDSHLLDSLYIKEFNDPKLEIYNLKKEIKKQQKKQLERIRKSNRIFRFSILAGIFAELESASIDQINEESFEIISSIDSTIREISTDVEVSSNMPSTLTWRAVIRPAIDLQGRNWSFKFHPYFKYNLFDFSENNTYSSELLNLKEENKIDEDINTALDFRMELLSELTIKGGPIEAGVSYQFFKDNLPPQSVVVGESLGRSFPYLLTAQDIHHVVRFKFTYNFQ